MSAKIEDVIIASLDIIIEQNETLVREKLECKEWQRCPKCGILTEKIDGCNYLQCSFFGCKTEWCWMCGLMKGNEEGKCKWNNAEHNSH